MGEAGNEGTCTRDTLRSPCPCAVPAKGHLLALQRAEGDLELCECRLLMLAAAGFLLESLKSNTLFAARRFVSI